MACLEVIWNDLDWSGLERILLIPNPVRSGNGVFAGSASVFLSNFLHKNSEVSFRDRSGDGIIDAADYEY